MNWELVAQNVGMFFVGSGFLTTLIYFLLRTLLKKDIEKFKHDLNRVAFEHQVKFESLHQKRADVIAELYGYIVESERATTDFLSPVGMASDYFDNISSDTYKKQKSEVALRATVELIFFFDKHKIYLSDDLCNKIDKFISELSGPTIDCSSFFDVPESNQVLIKEKCIVWRDAYKRVASDIPLARKALEDEFRKIIGMSDKT